MIWLVGEIWAWLLVSAVAGAGVTALLGTQRVRSERWVAQPPRSVELMDARSLLEPEPAEERPSTSAPETLASSLPFATPVDVPRETPPEVDAFPYAKPVEAVRSRDAAGD